MLRTLDTLDYDQLWLMAVDTGGGLSEQDAAGITRFRARGGGIVTARDHQDLGSCLLRLESIGPLNHFHTKNPEADAVRDDQDNPNISWPNYHSGANGNYQPVFATEPVHELMQTTKTPSGRIEWFPAHPHEGAVSAPAGAPSFVTDLPGDEIKRDPSRLAIFKDHVLNITRWLAAPATRTPSGGCYPDSTSRPNDVRYSSS
jgi:hypothetical protein